METIDTMIKVGTLVLIKGCPGWKMVQEVSVTRQWVHFDRLGKRYSPKDIEKFLNFQPTTIS